MFRLKNEPIVKHHIIISGTGRSGTSFLMQLFTALNLDTGFNSPYTDYDEFCKAGLEKDIRGENVPYIVKSPWICDYIDEILSDRNIIIDHAIIPIRDLYSAAESRRFVSEKFKNKDIPIDEINGGLWHTKTPDKQEDVLANQFYRLIYYLTLYEIPITFIQFPEFSNDPVYLYNKLNKILKIKNYKRFYNIFNKINKPELIHNFRK